MELHAGSPAITFGATSKGDIITATKATWSPVVNSGPLGDLGQVRRSLPSLPHLEDGASNT